MKIKIRNRIFRTLYVFALPPAILFLCWSIGSILPDDLNTSVWLTTILGALLLIGTFVALFFIYLAVVEGLLLRVILPTIEWIIGEEK